MNITKLFLSGFIILSLFTTACKQENTTEKEQILSANNPQVANSPKELVVNGFENSGLAYPIVKEFTMPILDACNGTLEDFKKALIGAGMRWIKNPGKMEEWTPADQEKFSPEAAVLVPTKNGNYTAVFIEFAYHALNDINAYTVTIDKEGKVIDNQQHYTVALCGEEGTYTAQMSVNESTIKHILKVEGGDDTITEKATK